MASLLQIWVQELPLSYQFLLILPVRGPDGVSPNNVPLMRWYRRCVLLSPDENAVLEAPWTPSRGFAMGRMVVKPHTVEGPVTWEEQIKPLVDVHIQSMRCFPLAFCQNFMQGVEILGYKHPVVRIRQFWFGLYEQLAKELHLQLETELQFDDRMKYEWEL